MRYQPLVVTDDPQQLQPFKRTRTNSHGYLSAQQPIPISWASRPVDLNAQRPANPISSSGYKSFPRFSTRRQIHEPTSSSTSGSGSTSAGFTSASTSTSGPTFHSSDSRTRLGMRKERSLDGFTNPSGKMRMTVTPPPPSSSPPLPSHNLSFSRLTSAPSVLNRLGARNSIKLNDPGPSTPNRRPLPFNSPSTPIAPIININTRPPSVIIRPTITGPRDRDTTGPKQKLQLSLQIPAIPMLGEEIRERRKPQLQLITDSSIHSSPNIKLSPSSPSISPSAISYVSYSNSPTPPNRPSPTSPTHSSLFSADSKLHLHPLSPIATTHTGSGTASARTSISVRGWIIEETGGGGGGGGGVSPGGRSVKSVGGRSVRSWKSKRSSRRSSGVKTISTTTSVYVHVTGDHVGEHLGADDVYVEDGWGAERSPSPMRYARPDSRGNLTSDTEDGVGSDINSEVEFADVDGDDDDDDEDEDMGYRRRIWTRRRSRRDRGRPRCDTIPNTTVPSPPAFMTHPLSPSSPSSSSTKSYSNPYSTRKDRKRARKNQLRSFRNSYRMPPSILQDHAQEREKEQERKDKPLPKKKSAKDYFNSVSASVSASYSQYPQSQSQSRSGTASTTVSMPNTRNSSPERGRKSHVTKKRRKFAEAVSSALEEVTSRGRSGGGGAGGSPTLLQQQLRSSSIANTTNTSINTTNTNESQKLKLRLSSKAKPITTMAITTLPVPAAFQPSFGGYSTMGYPNANHHYSLGSIPFDEMEVLDISLPPGEIGGVVDLRSDTEVEDEVTQVEMNKKTISMGGGISSSLPESGRFSTLYNGSDGTEKSTHSGGTGKPLPLPGLLVSQLPLISRDSESQLPSRRGSSLGRDGVTNTTTILSNNNRRPYPYRNNQLQLQAASTMGISCGLPVSRPSARPRPLPSLSAPSSS